MLDSKEPRGDAAATHKQQRRGGGQNCDPDTSVSSAEAEAVTGLRSVAWPPDGPQEATPYDPGEQ